MCLQSRTGQQSSFGIADFSIYSMREGEHLEILWTYMKVSLIMWTEVWSEISLTNKLFSYITFGYSAKCPEMPTKPLDLSHIAAF